MKKAFSLRMAVCAGIAVLACACGSGAQPAPPTRAPQTTAAATSTPAASIASPTASPEAVATPSGSSEPPAQLIVPGSVEPGPALETIWEAAGPSGEEMPFNPAIDPEGRIWVAGEAGVGEGANQFMIFDADGNYLETWGESGSSDGQFDFQHPWSGAFGGIAFADDGTFYVSEGGNRRVQRFDPERNFLGSWGTFGPGEDEFLAPDSIAIDDAGNVYVHDVEQGVHKVFTAEGEFVRTLAEGSSPWVAVSDAGYVYAQMPGNVLNEYAPDGSLVRSIDLRGLAQLPRVADVEVDDAGRLWVTSIREGDSDVPDKLFVLGPDGRLLHRWDGFAATQFALSPAGDRIYATFFGEPSLNAYAVPQD